MMKTLLSAAVLTAGILAAPIDVQAAIVTMGPGGFDDGWATTITFDDDATAERRGTDTDRDNGLNALGAADGKFFELGFKGFADFTFGTTFDTSASVFEVTFGSASTFPEFADIFVGAGGSFQFVERISNAAASGASGGSVTLAGLAGGPFDTIRFLDASPLTSTAQSDDFGALGGFDIDAVRVELAPVPLPAGALLMLTALGGLAAARRGKRS